MFFYAACVFHVPTKGFLYSKMLFSSLIAPFVALDLPESFHVSFLRLMLILIFDSGVFSVVNLVRHFQRTVLKVGV